MATDLMKFTVGMVPCESESYDVTNACEEDTLYSYTPEVGAEYYTFGITFNPYRWCHFADGDSMGFDGNAYYPECPVAHVPMDCDIPAGTDFCYEGPHEYRLLAHDGDAGFMVSDTCLEMCSVWREMTGLGPVPFRVGGSTYSYNLAASVQYTEGHWVAPDIDYAIAFADQVYDMRTSVASGNTNSQCLHGIGTLNSGHCQNLFELSDQAWAMVSWSDRSSWGYVADAMKYMLAGVFMELWNGMTAMSGTLMGGFVHSIEAVAELGHWLVINLPKIAETVINASVWILDNVDLILETMLIALGAWLFYFVLRVLLLITSHIKLAILRGPFE